MSKINELIQTLCPDGVEYKKIRDVCLKIVSGGTPKSSRADYYGGNHPWLRTQEVNFNQIDETSRTITDDGLNNSSAQYIPAWSVIVAMYGATVGRVAYNSIPLTTNQACCNLIIDDKKVTYKYVFYWLSSQYEYIKSLGRGSQTNINADTVKNLEIPVPPLPVQDEIVRILDEYTELEAELEAKLSEEIELKQKQYEFYRDKLIFSTNGRAAKLLDFLVQPITDGPHTTPVLVENGVHFISASAIENGRIDFSKQQGFVTKEFDLECAKKYKPRKYDVFMVKSGSTTGKVGYVDTDEDFNIWSPLAAMRANSYIESRYLYYLLQTEFIQSQVRMKMSHGSQPNLSMRVLEKFDIIIPTIDEQERIVKIFEKLEMKFNDFISALNTELESRKKQYAYYRDQLLTFKRKE